MSDMTAALERITACEFSHNKPTGMSAQEVEKYLSFFPFRLAHEAYEFYQWAGVHTGDTDGDPCDWTYDYRFDEILWDSEGRHMSFISIKDDAESCYPVVETDDPKLFPFFLCL